MVSAEKKDFVKKRGSKRERERDSGWDKMGKKRKKVNNKFGLAHNDSKQSGSLFE